MAACTGAPAGPDDGGDGDPDEPRVVIYQLVVRLFGNTDGTNAWNGSLEENGVGKFADVDETALSELRELGATHVWLTGVLQQATATGYPEIDQPADDPDVLKGRAGSFFAVKDYFDVSPDYAEDPASRMAAFEALVERIHDADMKVLIDFVPNHVARTYHSDVKPELDFGEGDDTSRFFDPDNDFFYLVEPPGQSLSLPNPEHWPRPDGADGTLEREDNDGEPPGDVPRATGNDVTSAAPAASDWYETVKLNWGYDFTTGEEAYEPIPDTWHKMDRVLAYWQDKGVDGFRCDFAHLVPLEAWRWLLDRARQRDPDAYFVAEAFEGAGGPPGFSLAEAVKAGFDAVYDDRTYDAVKRIACCGGRADDLDGVLPGDFLSPHMLRYAENHDERRIASPVVEGEGPDASGFGSYEAGKPAAGLLYLLGNGPILVYNGQEVGEEAAEAEGFGRADGRTTIFDYWTMPRMAAWVNGGAYDGGGLEPGRRELRSWYAELLELAQKPGLASGNFYSLQSASNGAAAYDGRVVYSYLRYDRDRGEAWLVVANLGAEPQEPVVRVPREAGQFAGFDDAARVRLEPALAEGGEPVEASPEALAVQGVTLSLDGHELAVRAIEWGE